MEWWSFFSGFLIQSTLCPARFDYKLTSLKNGGPFMPPPPPLALIHVYFLLKTAPMPINLLERVLQIQNHRALEAAVFHSKPPARAFPLGSFAGRRTTRLNSAESRCLWPYWRV